MKNQPLLHSEGKTDKSQQIELLSIHDLPVMAVLIDELYNIQYANNQFRHVFCKHSENEGWENCNFLNKIDPWQLDRFKHHLLSSNISGASYSGYAMYKLREVSGNVRQYNIIISPSVQSEFKGYSIAMYPDNSMWEQPFASLDAREMFLEQFQNENFGTFEKIIGVDKSFWSDGLYKIFEIDPLKTEVSMNFFLSTVHPFDVERVERMTHEAIKTDKILDFEYRIITPALKIKILHAFCRTIQITNPHGKKFIGSIRDVTAQRAIEQDLNKKMEELYQSNRELEDFAFVASHDLQEPLRKIATFGGMLQEKAKANLGENGQFYLSRLLASAENMKVLIDDLLEFSRVSKVKDQFERTDLNLMLKIVKTDLELNIYESKAQLTIGILPTIEAIPSQMKQLFTNIIGNALKFSTTRQEPIVKVESELLSTSEKLLLGLVSADNYYSITITDNGIGFDNKFAERIFKAFHRLHGKAEYQGTGLGLAICKKIVDHHHGVISAQGKVGNGAVFTIVLPEIQRITQHDF